MSLQSKCFGWGYSRKGPGHPCCPVIQISVNEVSTIFRPPHLTMAGLDCHVTPNSMSWLVLSPKRQMTRLLPHPKSEPQWRANDLSSYTFDNQWAPLLSLTKVTLLIGVIAEKAIHTLIAPFKKWASTERQQLLPLHCGNSTGYVVTSTNHLTISCISRQKLFLK